MTDKDTNERNVIHDIFPDAQLLICLFHALRTFHREITCDKLGITPQERDQSKVLFEKICYSHNEEEYQKLYDTLKSFALAQVMDYFDKNWHAIRNEWAVGLTYESGNFLNRTNNRLESFNGKLKSVIDSFSNLQEFFEKLFVIINCVRIERDSKALLTVQKWPTTKFLNAVEEQYFRLLTPYAFDFLKKQLLQKSTIIESTTDQSCSCGFFRSMKLPCKHIFKKREHDNLLLFDPTICDNRWTRNYYTKSHVIFNALSNDQNNSSLSITHQPAQRTKCLTSYEKFRKASIYSSKISEILSTVSNDQFHRKIEQLKLIIDCWANNKELSIKLLEDDTCVLEENDDIPCFEDYIIEEEVDDEDNEDQDSIIIPSTDELFSNFPNSNEPVGKY